MSTNILIQIVFHGSDHTFYTTPFHIRECVSIWDDDGWTSNRIISVNYFRHIIEQDSTQTLYKWRRSKIFFLTWLRTNTCRYTIIIYRWDRTKYNILKYLLLKRTPPGRRRTNFVYHNICMRCTRCLATAFLPLGWLHQVYLCNVIIVNSCRGERLNVTLEHRFSALKNQAVLSIENERKKMILKMIINC